ncbi:MAG: hypothetical protein EOP89_08690 [Lysobacteraceae bacterium]|nr:MAG: hypothetical protein EOP89_08690 [Xanthomonadaceae bacterium]
MITKRGWGRAALGAVGLTLGGGFAIAAALPSLTALSRVERGQWELKAIDSNAPTRSLCITDPRVLIHYGHDVGQCQHSVIANDTNTTTLHYACRGSHGQTTVKVATPRSFNLETQGIINGAPFEDEYEARRIGSCTPAKPL